MNFFNIFLFYLKIYFSKILKFSLDIFHYQLWHIEILRSIVPLISVRIPLLAIRKKAHDFPDAAYIL